MDLVTYQTGHFQQYFWEIVPNFAIDLQEAKLHQTNNIKNINVSYFAVWKVKGFDLKIDGIIQQLYIYFDLSSLLCFV